MALEDAEVKILPDLSKATLRQRALLRPLLDLSWQKGFTYRWGYPLSVTFRRETGSFTLQDPVPVPDWLQLLPRFAGRLGHLARQGPWPPRQRRERCRDRSASREEPRE